MNNDRKNRIIFLAVLLVFAAISVTIAAFIIYYVFSDNEMPYFFNHFGLSIVLASIGVIAFVLPFIGQKKYSDDSKDSMMIIVSGLLFLTAILSIIMSYLGIGFYSN